MRIESSTPTTTMDASRAPPTAGELDELFPLLVESVLDYAIFVLDPRGHVATWNRGAQRIKGYRAEEIIGRHFSAFYPPEEVASGKPAYELAVASEEGRFEDEGWRVRSDGTRFWANVVITALRDATGTLRGFAKVTRDLTIRREAEEMARRLAAEEAASAERRRVEHALRDADRRKDEFLAVLSHELRNPLASIRNAYGVLDREPDGEQAARARDVIGRQVQQLTRLVDDLLDVTRISRGKIQLLKERIDLGATVWKTVEDHRALLASRDLSVAIRGPQRPVHVDGDAARLSQVVGNLLQNAAKFTDPGGHVVVSVDRDGPQAVLRVTDDGCGITPDVIGVLFQPFMQADRTLERSRGGLGLGLALVKGIVELHGGTVRAQSEGEGRGTEVTVTLPAAPGPGRAASTAAAQAGPRRRILIVDDNEDAALTLRDLLELYGHEAHTALDGQSGLEAAGRLAPDVVLCDLGLPGIDGYEVARRLRAAGATATLVAITGYATPADAERARRAGFDHHLSKPPDLEKLRQILLAAGPTAAPRA